MQWPVNRRRLAIVLLPLFRRFSASDRGQSGGMTAQCLRIHLHPSLGFLLFRSCAHPEHCAIHWSVRYFGRYLLLGACHTQWQGRTTRPLAQATVVSYVVMIGRGGASVQLHETRNTEQDNRHIRSSGHRNDPHDVAATWGTKYPTIGE